MKSFRIAKWVVMVLSLSLLVSCGGGGGGGGEGTVTATNITVTDSVAPNNDHQVPFGSITQGNTSDQTVTITNSGNANLVISSIASANTLTAPFSISASACSGQTIAPAGSCTLTVRFAPTGTGSFTDSFDIPSNDPDTSSVTISVSGTGSAAAVPNIAVTDSIAPNNDHQVPFGSVTQGSTSDQTVTVTNSGNANLVISTIASANALTVPFGISADNCSGKTITSSATCTLTVRFAPTGTGSFTDSFDIPSNDPDEPSVTVSVSGTGLVLTGSIHLAKTGQTTSYAPGDDGDLKKGVSWPVPRFTNGDGTTPVTGSVAVDQLTGLMWLKNANCMATSYASFDADSTAGNGAVTWQHALDFVGGINAGTYVNCGAGYSDWRLPNARELRSLVDYSRYNPALPSGHPFTSVQANNYWTSTSNGLGAFVVTISQGNLNASVKSLEQFVWPVRAGQ